MFELNAFGKAMFAAFNVQLDVFSLYTWRLTLSPLYMTTCFFLCIRDDLVKTQVGTASCSLPLYRWANPPLYRWRLGLSIEISFQKWRYWWREYLVESVLFSLCIESILYILDLSLLDLQYLADRFFLRRGIWLLTLFPQSNEGIPLARSSCPKLPT